MKEHKHFNMRRLLTVVLMLALILSTAATGYAADLTESVCENPDPGKVIKTDWTNFRGNQYAQCGNQEPGTDQGVRSGAAVGDQIRHRLRCDRQSALRSW